VWMPRRHVRRWRYSSTRSHRYNSWWSYVVSFTSRSFYLRGKIQWKPFNRKLDGPPDAIWRGKNPPLDPSGNITTNRRSCSTQPSHYASWAIWAPSSSLINLPAISLNAAVWKLLNTAQSYCFWTCYDAVIPYKTFLIISWVLFLETPNFMKTGYHFLFS